MPGKYEGKINIAVGMTKQKLGKWTNNPKLQKEGQFQKIKGITQDATVSAQAAVKGATSTVLKQARKSATQASKKLDSSLGQVQKKFKP